ncbi:MAG: acetyl-CoA carboxylase biotin carboxylase subunit [Erysipelothrix sp.]|nr:acetyl-CoA carboxylase biotin carboxylase subunit [Erysipelothrix sp.]
MIQKVLIANRGEIAVRIIRACRELNLSTVAVYSNVDKDALHVHLADEAVCIGDYNLSNSYLNENAILQAAVNTNAHAIHPGYGFLSENASFAKSCERMGIEFIGPSSALIELMGDKHQARETMRKAGVPIVPGSKGLVKNVNQAYKEAKIIGLPLLIKASAGGGGRGMRLCYSMDEIEDAYHQATQEAKLSFGNADVYMEKFIEKPRHIEVQILGDKFGNVVHVFERECSVQRNNQKMLEEAPCTNLSEKTKEKLYTTSVEAAKSVGYESCGTIEYIMDKEENFYFIEMNTRIQVEHPITEMISGVDLVKEQLSIAQGNPISFKQSDIKAEGISLELRITAEDPYNNFRPSSGKLKSVHFPGGMGVRIDSFVYSGYTVLPFYDSLIAKVILYAKTRDEVIEKAIRCLEEIDLDGINTNVDFLLEVLLNESFLDHKYDTSLIKTMLENR